MKLIKIFMTTLYFIIMANTLFAQEHDEHKHHDHEKRDKEIIEANKRYDAAWGKWRDDLFDVKIEPGMIVGEIGVGKGELAVLMAKSVGRTSHVYANEIDEQKIETIKKLYRKEDIKNMTTVLGEVDDPLFPVENLDLSIMAEVYHHPVNSPNHLKNI